MSAKYSVPAITAALLLTPTPLLAGGLPRLCLPVDGVTADNSADCTKRIADTLGRRAEQVEMRRSTKQWYVLFALDGEQLNLGKLDAAFKGSPFSIPRDDLRLFGEVVLEVEIGEGPEQKLLADLKGVKHFKVEESKREKGVLLVTAVTLYPPHTAHRAAEFGKLPVEKELFGTEASDFAPKADPPATARDLPAYAGLRAIVEKNSGAFKGIRWKLLGCHVQGAVAVSDAAAKRK